MRRVTAVLIVGASACSSSEHLFVPSPDFSAEIQTIFYAVMDAEGQLIVFAEPRGGSPSILQSDAVLPEDLTIYAVGDRVPLEDHGLAPGVVAPVTSEAGRGLPSSAVRELSLARDPPSWTNSSLTAALERFRFASDVPISRCARLEKLAEYDYLDLQSTASPAPALIALDEERLFVIAEQGTAGYVLTPTSSQAVDLGIQIHPGVPRATYRAPDGEIFIGGQDGEVFRGRPETGFRLFTRLMVPPQPDEPERALWVQAVTGSRSASEPFEVFAATAGYFVSLEPAQEIILRRPDLGTSAQDGGAVWLSPGRVVFAVAEQRGAHELRDGQVRPVSTGDVDITAFDYVEGFGAVAATLDGRLHVFDEASGAFEVLAENLTTRDSYIAGNSDRIFVFSAPGVLEQLVPGEPLCPSLTQVPRSRAQVVVYGAYLAKAGSYGVEIWAIRAP